MTTADILGNLLYIAVGFLVSWLTQSKKAAATPSTTPATPVATPAVIVPAVPATSSHPLLSLLTSLGHGQVASAIESAASQAAVAALSKMASSPPTLPAISGVDPTLAKTVEQAALSALLSALTKTAPAQAPATPAASPAVVAPVTTTTPVSLNLNPGHTVSLGADGSLSVTPNAKA